jgi:Tol biopolymer transport system component
VVAGEDLTYGAAVSPDGRCLAYASNESGRSEVYVRPFPDGSGRTQVSAAGGTWPLWSRDGRWLLYTQDADADPSHRRVAVATEPGDCITIPKGSPTPMAAPPGERLVEIREVPPDVQSLDVVAIQGWADSITAP